MKKKNDLLNEHNEAWMSTLFPIELLLQSETAAAMWLDDININFATGRVLLTCEPLYEEDIRQALVPPIEEILKECGVSGVVEIASKMAADTPKDAAFVEQIKKLLPNYSYLGHVRNFVIASIYENDAENVVVFEVNRECDRLDEYSFAAVCEEDVYRSVLKAFGKKMLERN